MSVRLKLRLASQRALADLLLPKHMLHASQSSSSSKSNREGWALSWGRDEFFQSVRTAGSAILTKAVFHLSKEAMHSKTTLSSSLPQRQTGREMERVWRKPVWLPVPGVFGGTAHCTPQQ